MGYEVYLPSFADGDGDGIGDLRGLVSRLDYLAWLGVGAVWVTPFYPSPMRDGGYDVSDYRGVDPRFGTLDDFDHLVTRAHELELRVVIDLVANHTSSEHPWFVAARSSRDSPYRDWYIWRKPRAGNRPPNNWLSHFGGSAWSFDEHTGESWLHLFSPEQPDLNWRNPAVAREFEDILRFWLERGVDGFRVDVAHGLLKHPDLPDNPEGVRGLRLHELDQDGVLDIYRRWRTIVEPYGAILLGEVYLSDAGKVARYVCDDDGLHLAFWFGLIDQHWDPVAIRDALVEPERLSCGRFAWLQSSHDRSRPASRYAGGELGARRALALSTLLAGLPGMPFLYMGEELGLPDVDIPADRVRDAKALRTGDYRNTRDRSRTPMPWQPVEGLNFTTASSAWLPLSGRAAADTVAVQQRDPSSLVNAYRRLARWRREDTSLHGSRPVEWLASGPEVLCYRRGRTVVTANCSAEEMAVALPPGDWHRVFSTAGEPISRAAGTVRLPPYAATSLVAAAG
jgi:alpha-glucosidase